MHYDKRVRLIYAHYKKTVYYKTPKTCGATIKLINILAIYDSLKQIDLNYYNLNNGYK